MHVFRHPSLGHGASMHLHASASKHLHKCYDQVVEIKVHKIYQWNITVEFKSTLIALFT